MAPSRPLKITAAQSASGRDRFWVSVFCGGGRGLGEAFGRSRDGPVRNRFSRWTHAHPRPRCKKVSGPHLVVGRRRKHEHPA